jgi:membrane glycosyltransferase
MGLDERQMRLDRFVLGLRRAVLLILIGGSTGVATWLMSQVIAANGLDVIGCAALVLFALNFGWLAASFWTAVLGFAVRLAGGDSISLTAAAGQALVGRTAILMPIHNEEPRRVSAGLRAVVAGLMETGEAAHFDIFVLSDTPNAGAGAAEQAMIEALRRQHPAGPTLYYRRRQKNVGRKAGNIEDFIRRWGAGYRYMLVLDADSVMSGSTLVALARMMEAHPDVGIVQALPVPTNRETPFARILQFASRLYGPIQASGLAFWAGGDSIYYGHNAIIRTDAFARLCGLPLLPGKPPLGGEILSHDFVEGALIGGGGYKIWFAPHLSGSYEDMPANVLDFAKRDRRWCQGNLQHARLLGLPMLTRVGRLHMGMGVFAYLTSPLWLALLVLSTFDAVQRALAGTEYFKPGFNLFPNWPVATDFQIHLLLGMTLAALFLPKLLGLSLVLFSRSERQAFGGAWRLCTSVLVEVLFSALLAPMMMLFQTLSVGLTLLGRSVVWEAQPRDDRGVGWREALRRLGWHTLVGATWAGGVYAVTPDFFWWLTPIWLGLVLSLPLSVWSSRRTLGLALKRIGLFLTPEETRPPPELSRLRQALQSELNFEGLVPVVNPEALVPPEAGVAMPRLIWPQGTPAVVQEMGYSATDLS